MSTGHLSEIPLIDLGPYFAGDDADKRRVADEISRACERIGFFLVSGHGVDPALCARARRLSRAFFDLPLEEKLAMRRAEDDMSVRGYEPLGTEHLSATIGVEAPPDLKESISFGPLDLPDHPSCRTEAAAPLLCRQCLAAAPGGGSARHSRPTSGPWTGWASTCTGSRPSPSICPKTTSTPNSRGGSTSCVCSTTRHNRRHPRRGSSAPASIRTTTTSPSA